MHRLFSGSVLFLVLATALWHRVSLRLRCPSGITVAPPAPQVEVVPMAPSPRHVWIPGHWQWRPPMHRHVWVPATLRFVPPSIGCGARPVGERRRLLGVPSGTLGHGRASTSGHAAAAAAGLRAAPATAGLCATAAGLCATAAGLCAAAAAASLRAAAAAASHAQPQPQPVYAQPQPVYAQPQPGYDPGVPPDQLVEVDVAPPPPQAEVIPVAPSASHVWLPGYWNWNPGMRRHVWVAGHYAMRQHGAVWQNAQWVRFGPRWRYVPATGVATSD